MLVSSHVLCKVENLADAVGTWRSAGFEVQWGADPATSINALIWFESGPFIELINARGAQPAAAYRPHLPSGMIERFERWLAGPEGWCDLCLEAQGDILPHLDRLKRAGVDAFGPIVGSRTPPGGETINIQTCFPISATLPFFMGAYVPDARPPTVNHPNGATRISRIRLSIPADCDSAMATLIGSGDGCLEYTHGNYELRSITLNGLARSIAPDLLTGALISLP
ncbi:MAG: VOC family protein [Pseudomonadota bacterium]